MNRYKELLNNSVILAVGNLSVRIIQFLLMPLVTATMPTDQYGTAESLISLVELVLPLFTLGLTDAVFRFSMKEGLDTKSVFSSTTAVLLGGIMIVILGTFVAGSYMTPSYCIMFVLLYILIALTNVWGQFIRGLGFIKIFSYSGIVRAVLLAIFTYILVFNMRLGIVGYVMASVFAYLGALIMLVIGAKLWRYLSITGLDIPLLKTMIRYALPLIPNTICWWLIQVASRYILIYFCGEGDAGLYISSSKIASVINMFSTIFLQAWTISSVKSIADKDKSSFNSKVFCFYSAFIETAAAGLLLFLPLISSFLLKEGYNGAWVYSGVSILTAVISCYAAFFGAYYGAALQTKMVFISTLVGAVVSVVLCLIFVPLWGIAGALFAGLLGYLALTIIRIMDTQKFSNIVVPWLREAAVVFLIFLQSVLVLYAFSINQMIYNLMQAALFMLVILVKRESILAILSAAKKIFLQRIKS